MVGYHKSPKRAASLSIAFEREFGRKLTLVEGDLCAADVRRKFIDAVASLGSPIAGAAIFPGDPARVAWKDLNREALVASLESNYVGPVLLAKELGEVMEAAENGGSLVLLASMQALAAFPSSLNYAAPKAALVHAAHILAQQWNRVRVNVV